MKCKYCRIMVDPDSVYYYSPTDISHPRCYYNFLSGNKLRIDWNEKLT